MQKLIAFFSAPNFEDEQTARRARLLSFLINMHIGVTLSTTVLLLLFTDQPPIYPIAAFISSLPGFALRILLRRGRVSLASVLFVAIIFVIMPLLAWFSGTSAASVPVTIFQMITIVMAGLLLSEWGAFVFAAATGAMDGVLVYAEIHLKYVTSPRLDSFSAWVMEWIAFTAIAGMLFIANRLIRESFERAGRENEERRRAENEVRQLNEELEQKIAELERFAYTVSHELKTPLVTIQGFIGSIEQDLHNGKLDRARADFQRVSSATIQMHDTIYDLLELSRLGRVADLPEWVELTPLVGEILAAMHERLERRRVEVRLDPDLPTVHFNRERLREVFSNLIDNAVKYMGTPPEPQIEIGQRAQPDGTTLFVRDNGLGIEPQYHQRVFGLFERLNTGGEGTGVGLALVKRIVEMLGGRIWVESQGTGKGSTFCFTVPAEQIRGGSTGG